MLFPSISSHSASSLCTRIFGAGCGSGCLKPQHSWQMQAELCEREDSLVYTVRVCLCLCVCVWCCVAWYILVCAPWHRCRGQRTISAPGSHLPLCLGQGLLLLLCSGPTGPWASGLTVSAVGYRPMLCPRPASLSSGALVPRLAQQTLDPLSPLPRSPLSRSCSNPLKCNQVRVFPYMKSRSLSDEDPVR